MELTTILGVVATILQLVLGAFCVVLWSQFQEVKRRGDNNTHDLGAFKLHCSETYGTKDDLSKAIEQFSRSIDAVFAKLDRIEDKLDKKQDKS